MSEKFDYVVVGIGGIGSGALYWLTRNAAPGSKILGLEQFSLGHVRGGSQDVSRIVRKAIGYTEEPQYRQLAEGMYPAWEEIERESGLQLVYKCGGLQFIDPHSRDSGEANRQYWDNYPKMNLPGTEKLSGTQINQRWPAFTVHPDARGLYEPGAGLVDAAFANAAHQQRAVARGAKILSNTKVTSVTSSRDRQFKIKVDTDKGSFLCRKVIVTSGAWINQVLAGCGVNIPVTVTQENVTYFASPDIKSFTKENFPVMSYWGPHCHVYSLPVHGIPGFKIGCDAAGPPTTGDTRTFIPDPRRENYVRDWLKTNLPSALGRIIETKVCLYAMTKDRNFVVDTLSTQGYPDVIVCQGAGHAFKFAAVLGKILSEMAVVGKPSLDISAFTVNRPAVQDPKYPFWRDEAVISKI